MTTFKDFESSKNTTPFSFRVNKADKDLFQRQYPYCLSRFIKLCIKKAASDPQFFNEIYFNVR